MRSPAEPDPNMHHRKLGRTGLDVGEISLGTEYLKDVPRETTISVTREALDRGVNYMDMFYGDSETRDRFGDALEGRWDQVLFAGHLGAGVRKGESTGAARTQRTLPRLCLA